MHTLKTITLTLMLIIFSVTGLPAEEISFEQLIQLNQEGQQAYNIADYPTALKKWEQGLKLARQAKYQKAISVFLGNLGVVYQNLGQYKKALDYLQQTLSIHQEIGDKHGIGNNLTSIGIVYDKLGQYQKALQDALAIDIAIGSEEIWLSQRSLAFAEAKLNQPEPAIQHYEQALYNLEKLRAGITTKEHKISFMRGRMYVYDELIALLQSLHAIQPNKGDRKAI